VAVGAVSTIRHVHKLTSTRVLEVHPEGESVP
jgi:hypothetical protein